MAPLSAHAALSEEAQPHAQSALLFADRNDWDDALLHAKRTVNPLFIKLITWRYLMDSNSGANFYDITHFISENPNWPDQKRLIIRAEYALRDGSVNDSAILAFFENSPPITGIGKIMLLQALQRDNQATPEKTSYMVRDAWRNGDFDEPMEKYILENYSQVLQRQDHIIRADRLLWEGKITPAKRLLPRFSSNQQQVFKARIALMEDKKTAPLQVALVPKSQKLDPGLLYERLRFRARRDDEKGIREILLMTPAHVPYPEKWWKRREQQVRSAIDEHNYTLARKLLANHSQTEGSGLADATWLEGWLFLDFLKQPKAAYEKFSAMYELVRYPVSRSRAAYWAAQAAERMGDKETADAWYNKAIASPANFYGQLAAYKHLGKAPLHIPPPPQVTPEDRHRFDSNELIRVAKLAIELNRLELAERFINYVIESSENEADASLAAALGQSINYPHLSVRGAKKALQQGVILLDSGFPRPQTPTDLAVERPLALAITRQESEFDRHARSPSGALGLMQLMPLTARETAKKIDYGFHINRLHEPDYNMTIGSHYLLRMINSYDGSYVMAIAAYNAGPGNVRKWMQRFGTPGNDIDGAVNWIEKIPFQETRNYVQRVMENLQIYRYLEGGKDTPLSLGEDLMR